jgi:hypothetical protein
VVQRAGLVLPEVAALRCEGKLQDDLGTRCEQLVAARCLGDPDDAARVDGSDVRGSVNGPEGVGRLWKVRWRDEFCGA